MKKNNKGFTLVELLAVIVVLAIIMLVVANRVGSAMKDSRGESLALQAQSMQREVNKVCVLKNQVSVSDIENAIEGSDLTLGYTDDANGKPVKVAESSGKAYFVLYAKSGSKFANINLPAEWGTGIEPANYYTSVKASGEGDGGVYKNNTTSENNSWLKNPGVKITVDCPPTE